MRLLLIAFLVSSLEAFAPNLNPVTWSATLAPGSDLQIHVKASIAEGYHLYSLTTPKGGPIPTKLRFTPESGVASFSVEQAKPEVRMDATFGIPIESFAKETVFLVKARLDKNVAPGNHELTVVIRYQACSDIICLPPVERMVTTKVQVAGSKSHPPADHR